MAGTTVITVKPASALTAWSSAAASTFLVVSMSARSTGTRMRLVIGAASSGRSAMLWTHVQPSQPENHEDDCQVEQRHVEGRIRSEEHTSELQSLMRISYAVFCLKKKNTQ